MVLTVRKMTNLTNFLGKVLLINILEILLNDLFLAARSVERRISLLVFPMTRARLHEMGP